MEIFPKDSPSAPEGGAGRSKRGRVEEEGGGGRGGGREGGNIFIDINDGDGTTAKK